MTSVRLAEACVVGLLAVAAWAGASLTVAPFSRSSPGDPLPSGWEALTFRNIPRHTRYTLVRDADAGVVVKAEALRSASGLVYPLAVNAEERPFLRWRWKAMNLVEGGDVRRREGDDYPVRIYVSFRYSPERLSLVERARFAAARVLYGEYPPHAGLNYIWDARAPVGTMAPNPFTDRVRMIVVESGPDRLQQWLSYERDIVADYRRAFGEEPPPIAGVALMTDADNTGETVTAFYGDIELAPRR